MVIMQHPSRPGEVRIRFAAAGRVGSIELLGGNPRQTAPSLRACLPRGLEEFHDIAIWVLEQYLLSAWSFHDLVAEAKTSALHLLDACLYALELNDKTVPTARLGKSSIRHRSSCRALRPGEPKGEAALGDAGAGGGQGLGNSR